MALSLYEIDWIKRCSKNLPPRVDEAKKSVKKTGKDSGIRLKLSDKKLKGRFTFNRDKKKWQKEETEINELSHEKLGRYIKKASAEVASKSIEGAQYARDAEIGSSKSDWKRAVTAHGKAAQRQVGISKAVERLTGKNIKGGRAYWSHLNNGKRGWVSVPNREETEK